MFPVEHGCNPEILEYEFITETRLQREQVERSMCC
jgi:hypothetical protein